MAISVEAITGVENIMLALRTFSSPEYIYCLHELVNHYTRPMAFIAYQRCHPTALWLVPTVSGATGMSAERDVRIVPYCSPAISAQHPYSRRSSVLALAHKIKETFTSVSLPLSPDFDDAAAFSACGMFLEWRHTHRLARRDNIHDLMTSRARNAYRAAATSVTIDESSDPSTFEFEEAIVGCNSCGIRKRRDFAEALIAKGNGVILHARIGTSVKGSVLLLNDVNTTFLFHSWFRRTGPRGVSTFLIAKAVEWAFSRSDSHFFDFEGSVLCSVDRFFHSFGATRSAFAFIHWHTDRDIFARMLLDSVEIPGRRLR